MTDRTYTNPQTGEVVTDPTIRPFSAVLHELGEGTTESEMGEAFWDLLQRVQDTGKPGSLTLTIKITGDGLQPHLEAFMWEILKAIQVRVNADGLKMLLGT